MNIQQALQYANDSLHASSPSARLDAQVLLTHTLQCNSAHLMAWPEKALDDKQLNDYQQLITQRVNGTPVAHLTGQREFWSLDFFVNDSTLIPRPETETLVEFILDKFSHHNSLNLLDLGTGTGAIAIAIAHEKPNWSLTASDKSSDAITLCEKNSESHNIKNLTITQSDWFENINDKNFDVIVSNPPYIAINDPHLTQGDVRFEPESALTSGEDGMDDIAYLCEQTPNHLKSNGWLIIEHGYNQQQAVAECFTKNHYRNIIQQQDLSNQPRMTAGQIS